MWGGSSAGRASRSQCEGRGFDPLPLHHIPLQRHLPPAFTPAAFRKVGSRLASATSKPLPVPRCARPGILQHVLQVLLGVLFLRLQLRPRLAGPLPDHCARRRLVLAEHFPAVINDARIAGERRGMLLLPRGECSRRGNCVTGGGRRRRRWRLRCARNEHGGTREYEERAELSHSITTFVRSSRADGTALRGEIVTAGTVKLLFTAQAVASDTCFYTAVWLPGAVSQRE